MSKSQQGMKEIMVAGGEDLGSPQCIAKGSCSQVGQDKLILSILGYPYHGFFVDLAANDGVNISNSFLLERRYNWSGVCIEVNPKYFWRLTSRRCKLVYAAVGRSDAGKAQLVLRGGYGGIVGNGFDNDTQQNMKASKVTLRTVSLCRVLEMVNAPRVVHYMSLDVEGAEEYIMKAFCFERFTFLTMTVERPTLPLHLKLREMGYSLLNSLGAFGECLYISSQLSNYTSIWSQFHDLSRLHSTCKVKKWRRTSGFGRLCQYLFKD